MELQLDHVNCGYGKVTILKDISFTVKSGEFFCLLGPNGVGKTTLFKTILWLLKLQSGRILLDGEDIAKWSCQEFAKRVGYVPQAHSSVFEFKVLDVVAMGRAAYLGLWGSPSKADLEIAAAVLETLFIGYLKDSIYTEISGGERQLVLIARALAQKPDFLIMDEPTSNLDYGNQIRVLDYIHTMIQKAGLGVIMTTHSPNHALQYSSKVAAISSGGRFQIGRPDEVINPTYIKNTYHVNVQIVRPELGNGTEAVICVPFKEQNQDF
ncbi:putative siderophore transport system ATP-binding protein YusV [Sporomusa silvacetica DSM 10669]|uniref:Siderophore transport system ATP-binding protein YusV n=1 Tax=Sporomusa silvacetica DSM 10669 TaxID=1123289 RepID=A0ABZ3ISA1_9FIRM|nr:ABC transporter ATP-binding protein [Sporomusa silvacetica]OZC20828.1 putative siderophore transport system ATP-binding protein YusV [Sporomusa silvacetica DSM 10669]